MFNLKKGKLDVICKYEVIIYDINSYSLLCVQ